MRSKNLLVELLKLLNLKLDEEFKLECCSNFCFKFTDDGIMFKDKIFIDNWELSNLAINDLLKCKIEKIPYKERIEMGNKYYVVNPLQRWGFIECVYSDDKADRLLLERVEIFETEEEAREKVKELGWKV